MSPHQFRRQREKEMGNLGFPEMVVIMIVALLFFGTGKLPEIGKSRARVFRNSRRLWQKPNQAQKMKTAKSLRLKMVI